MKKDQTSVQVTAERTFILRRPTFKLFKNIEYLDTDKLSKGSHTIELGKFEGGSCDCAVTADISNGMIKKLNYPKCENATEISPKLARKLKDASKQLNPNGPPKWKDIPVAELSRSAGRAGIIVVVTASDDCYEVCIDPGTDCRRAGSVALVGVSGHQIRISLSFNRCLLAGGRLGLAPNLLVRHQVLATSSSSELSGGRRPSVLFAK